MSPSLARLTEVAYLAYSPWWWWWWWFLKAADLQTTTTLVDCAACVYTSGLANLLFSFQWQFVPLFFY